MRSAPESRAALVAVAAAFVAMTVLCVPFLLAGRDVPEAVVLLGRLVPGLASLIAVLALLGTGHLGRLWRLRPASPRELLASYGLALAVMVPTLVVPALVGLTFGAQLKPAGVLVAAVPTIVLGTVLFALSTFGEEVLWRGQLQSLLRRMGFWRSSALIGLVWMLWHLPLHLTYLVQGTLTGAEVVAATVGIAAWAPLLAALVERRGTIWPAVFAHAVPLSSLQLLSGATAADPATFWTVTVVGWVAMLVAAALVLRAGRRSQSRAAVPEGAAEPDSAAVPDGAAVPDSTVSQTSTSR